MRIVRKSSKRIRLRASQLFGKDPSEFTLDTKWEDLDFKSVQVPQITTYLEGELDFEEPYTKFRRCATFGETEIPIYWDSDTEGYIFLYREEFDGEVPRIPPRARSRAFARGTSCRAWCR